MKNEKRQIFTHQTFLLFLFSFILHVFIFIVFFISFCSSFSFIGFLKIIFPLLLFICSSLSLLSSSLLFSHLSFPSSSPDNWAFFSLFSSALLLLFMCSLSHVVISFLPFLFLFSLNWVLSSFLLWFFFSSHSVHPSEPRRPSSPEDWRSAVTLKIQSYFLSESMRKLLMVKKMKMMAMMKKVMMKTYFKKHFDLSD